MRKNTVKELKKREKEEKRRSQEIDGKILVSPVLGNLNAKKMDSIHKFVKENGQASDLILEAGIVQFNRVLTRMAVNLMENAKELVQTLSTNQKEVLLDLLYLFIDNVKLSKSHMKNALLRASSVGRLWMTITNNDRQTKNIEEYIQNISIDSSQSSQFISSLRDFSRVTISLRNFLKGSPDQQKHQLQTFESEESFVFVDKKNRKKSEKMSKKSIEFDEKLEEDFFNAESSLRIQSAVIGSGKNFFEMAADNDLEGVKSISRWISIDLLDDHHRNALHHAAMYNAIDVIDFLLEKGIRMNQKDLENFTPIEIACKYGHEKLAIYLKSRGAEFDAFSKNVINLMKRSDFSFGFWSNLSVHYLFFHFFR
eukprot:TRINITY_DN5274_c0_g1_i2.p2 TRINITY_DN5274_c0_g1~~TRINITY_DN5274_c0_g1_i2.p2  ORF type:complete len:368 (-),score=133.70 TRINITY_DN5274_c0_g1_i2:1317-2420(-)